jgi:hypothetical protein
MTAPTIVPAVAEISALSPNVSGGIWRAPLGTTLPTDTSTPLDPAFVSLGYADDDGVTRKEERPNTKQYAWGGALVASLQEHYGAALTFKLLQPINPNVLKAAHSDSNVTVTDATATTGTMTTTLLNPKLNVNSSYVIEGFYQLATMRLVIPIARITTIGDYKMTHKALSVYDLTLESFPDVDGNFIIQIWDDGIVS